MAQQNHISKEEVRARAEDILKSQLRFYSGQIIVAAEAGDKATEFEPPVALAAQGLHRLYHLPAKLIVLDSLEQRDGLAVVEAAFPQIIQRNEREWRALAASTWEAVQFETGVNPPQDRSVFGHIELIDALSLHQAYLPA